MEEATKAQRLGFLIDDQYQLHETGKGHPESPQRLKVIQTTLNAYERLNLWKRVQPRNASREELERIHHPGHVDRIEKAVRNAPAHLDPDTVVSAESFRIALLAAGGVVECVESVCGGALRRAFAFVRPPGHHAEPNKAMGFCLFNSVAVAAAHARKKYGLQRVAVVDIDLHHGNGTQKTFYQDPAVLYVSSHQYPYYPGTGSFEEMGEKAGQGYTLNFPLPAGTSDETFVPIYSRIIEPILEQYKPELILVSAGFDAYFKDPLGGLAVTQAGYAAAAAALIRAAERSSAGQICSVLEGGYSPEGLQECTRAVLAQMEAEKPPTAATVESPLFNQLNREAKRHFSGLWKW